MNQVTVRKISSACTSKAKQLAKARNVTLNYIYGEAIHKGLGLDSGSAVSERLAKYAGDSDFGEGWDDFLEKDLKQIDHTLFQ